PALAVRGEQRRPRQTRPVASAVLLLCSWCIPPLSRQTRSGPDVTVGADGVGDLHLPHPGPRVALPRHVLDVAPPEPTSGGARGLGSAGGPSTWRFSVHATRYAPRRRCRFLSVRYRTPAMRCADGTPVQA